MCCENCILVCSIFQCYSNLFVGKISQLSTQVDVFIENISTGRVVKETVTSNSSGVILLPAGTWCDMFATASELKIYVKVGLTATNIYPYISASSFSADSYECLKFNTAPLYNSAEEMYTLPNQILIYA